MFFLPSVIQKLLLDGQWTPSIYGTTHFVTIGNLVSAQIITEKNYKLLDCINIINNILNLFMLLTVDMVF